MRAMLVILRGHLGDLGGCVAEFFRWGVWEGWGDRGGAPFPGPFPQRLCPARGWMIIPHTPARRKRTHTYYYYC